MGNQVETTFDPDLAYAAMYYWRVDAVEADGTTHVGTMWSFITPSGEATDPDPADGAILEATAAVFSWTAGDGAALHDVYIGTDPNALEYQTTRSEPMVPIDGFVRGTTYYWQIVEVEADGITTHESPVWSFSIAEPSWSPVAIVNSGFEDPVLAEDDWTWLDVPGWTWVGGEGPGIWHVTSADFDPVLAPEGQNVLYTENAVGDAGGVAQVLTETFTANMDYTLTVEVGNSWYYYFSGYSVQLLAGGVVIAEDNDTLWPEYMKWATSTVAYTYDPADAALVGQPLEIRLLTLALDKDNPPAGEVVGVEFDNVRLEAAE
jgi:hypothetical protein